MRSDLGGTLRAVETITYYLAAALLVALAAAAAGATLAAASGLLPWIELPLWWAGAPVPAAGPVAQIVVTVLLLSLLGFLPGANRVRRLEATHRDFSIRMEDVARAYWEAHAADRAGVFGLGREYDAVRERLEFLKTHPDLDTLDHKLLEVAAQMSHEARELAQIYSDDKVHRAREMLALRKGDAAAMTDRIAEAHRATEELRRMLDETEMDEAVVRSRLGRLRDEVADLALLTETPAAATPERRRATIGVVPGE